MQSSLLKVSLLKTPCNIQYKEKFIDKIEINGDLDRISKWGNSGYSFKWSRQWNPKFYNSLNISYSEYYNYQDD
mgnify:CR=1 FL=1